MKKTIAGSVPASFEEAGRRDRSALWFYRTRYGLAAPVWTAAAPCVDLTTAAKSNGLPVDIVTNSNAYHDFDHPSFLFTRSMVWHSPRPAPVKSIQERILPARADAIMRVPAFLAR